MSYPSIHTALALALAGLAAAQTAVTTPPESLDASRVPFYKLLRPGLAVAGQPTPETLAQLAALGFRTVINLRTDGEPGVPEERSVVEGQGLRYVHVPVTPQSISQADVDAVAGVLDDPAAAPVLFHCGSSNRVGAVIAVIAARNGSSLEAALEQGRQAGLKSEAMVEAVRRVVAAPTS